VERVVSDWIARRCHVSGRVQGVFYRASTRDRARELGVTGYARNLSDGRVEVFACGDPAAVEALCRWLWLGSPASHVTAVEVNEVPTAKLDERPVTFRTA
jgi:acylphosphatase